MDLSTTLSVVQTILTAIQTLDQMRALCSISDCKRVLEDLQNTVETVKAVLEDAAAKQDSLNSQEKHYIKELKDAVYDADDVLDEFLTLAKRKQLIQAGDRVSDKVKSFFSRFKLLTHNISNKVKMVNKRLDGIAAKSNKFSFKVEYTPTKFTKEETSSFLCDEIIGRGEDVERIVGMLLGSDNGDQSNVSFLAIVGMGGLGKTALAQLVFNDPRISEAFEFKTWTCIADQDQEKWDVKAFLGKVVKDLPVGNKHELTSLEQIHHEVKEQLAGKKYLLVLDDVWTESYDKWQQFEGFLRVGQRGSRIVVTTRSKTTAQMIGGDQVHELRGLSETESWHLFERMAFHVKERDEKLVELGKEIVKKCTNVPLAIRVVGSLLRGQSKSMWLSFHENGLNTINESNDSMTCILKLSYDQLEPSLKICFAYCAIFPKDWKISKQTLIQLWMAQGYINLENRGEEYFLMLLQRCFFQDVREDKYGEIKWFKMHDLFHDIAEQVAGEEISRVDFVTSNVGKGVRHVSLMNDYYADDIFNKTRIRTYLQVSQIGGMLLVEHLLANCPSLRTLDLRGAVFEVLPNSIGKLLHLRYLDLSFNKKLKVLPKAITKLLNLQTLNLLGCRGLRALPKGLSNLNKLRVLDVKDCYLPLYMPPNFGKLTCLQKLDRFGMGDLNPYSEKTFDQLEDLKALVNLKGSIGIQLRSSACAPYQATGGAYMSTLEHLSAVEIWYLRIDVPEEFRNKDATDEYEEAILEDLQPHFNLKYFRLVEYSGEKLPTWALEHNLATFLPNLVRIELNECSGLHHLPWFGLLQCLKLLRLQILPNLEYLMNVNPTAESVVASRTETKSLFPCLEHLYLENLPKLKGWWPGSNPLGGNSQVPYLCLPQLKGLWIYQCPEMATIPLCPLVDDLRIIDANRSLEMKTLDSSNSSTCPTPMRVSTGNVKLLQSVPIENFQRLREMRIREDNQLKSLSEVEELFKTCLSTLQVLEIWRCPKLESLFGGLEHLTALKKLQIRKTAGLLTDDEHGGVPWQYLAPTLQSLKLEDLPHLVNLPNGMQYLTSLESLSIVDCMGLMSLPKWMPKLTSLAKLEVRRCCTELKGRCTELAGEDWLNIQHIPDILIEE